MIDPVTVELLVFDLDGTISATTEPIFHAVKAAFGRLSISFTLQRQYLEQYFGAPSEIFYRGITPEDCGIPWQTVREVIHEEQPEAFRKYGQAFDGVYETLTGLRERGYRLALCSNCTPHYFTTVINALDLSGYFDYMECVGEYNLTKPEVVHKIIRHFGDPVTAMVGDRLHDIEAAGKNRALSIGCMYGYGDNEPKQADITIATFAELLHLFDRRNGIFTNLFEEITARKSETTPFITGITGIDASGKTVFTEGFKDFLERNGCTVQVIHIDDFHNPKRIRYAGDNEADNYYHRSFDIKTIIDSLLIPARKSGSFKTELTLLNLETDKYDTVKRYRFTPDTIVLLEGVFLLREELRPYINLLIFLAIPLGESKTRALSRDSETVLSRYDTKYTPAQRTYLKQNPPERYADIIIDNLNWNDPEIVSKDKK